VFDGSLIACWRLPAGFTWLVTGTYGYYYVRLPPGLLLYLRLYFTSAHHRRVLLPAPLRLLMPARGCFAAFVLHLRRLRTLLVHSWRRFRSSLQRFFIAGDNTFLAADGHRYAVYLRRAFRFMVLPLLLAGFACRCIPRCTLPAVAVCCSSAARFVFCCLPPLPYCVDSAPIGCDSTAPPLHLLHCVPYCWVCNTTVPAVGSFLYCWWGRSGRSPPRTHLRTLRLFTVPWLAVLISWTVAFALHRRRCAHAPRAAHHCAHLRTTPHTTHTTTVLSSHAHSGGWLCAAFSRFTGYCGMVPYAQVWFTPRTCAFTYFTPPSPRLVRLDGYCYVEQRFSSVVLNLHAAPLWLDGSRLSLRPPRAPVGTF